MARAAEGQLGSRVKGERRGVAEPGEGGAEDARLDDVGGRRVVEELEGGEGLTFDAVRSEDGCDLGGEVSYLGETCLVGEENGKFEGDHGRGGGEVVCEKLLAYVAEELLGFVGSPQAGVNGCLGPGEPEGVGGA